MKAALGIDIGGTKIRAGLVREDGDLLAVVEMKTEADKGASHVVSRILSIVEQFSNYQFEGVGIGTAGQVGLDGTILSATQTFPGWSGIELEKTISSETCLPVKIVNDVQAMALGELNFGEGKGIQNFLCLALGTGVGGAIVVDGKLYRGASGAAGEMGHLVIRHGGRKCPCGKNGCLEAYVSGTALAERYTRKFGDSKKSTVIIQESLLGNKDAVEVMRELLDELACGLASLAAVFNPEKIILGGGLAEGLIPYLPSLSDKVGQQLSPAAQRPLKLSISTLGGNAMILGASSLILKGGNFS